MRYICIHGHFYQPPRENPKTGVIDVQPSAKPFPNWNYRITSECYQANTASPILGETGEAVETVNNYSYISFNFGPTLLRWMEAHDSETHKAIVTADRESIQHFGQGTALAQVYHHAILPLCNERDKRTEIQWGIDDFQHRFNRLPDGMWLAETAVDIDSLEALAELGIAFTILAPKQAVAIAQIGTENWIDINEHSLDTTRPYLVELPSGRSIALFFYHGGLAHSVAFAGVLDNGENFAHQIRSVAVNSREGSLIHFATDGESYGHHHRYGDMALAYCLRTLDTFPEVEICNYATYLKKNPPTMKVRLHEVSAWSCAHGVGRWSENCGCVMDPALAGKQQWRRGLRDSLNWLRDQMSGLFEQELQPFIGDPWGLRDRWQKAVLRNETEELITEFADGNISYEQRERIEQWLEIQRHCLMMFTSCGWFFDDFSGLEGVQILRYAKRAIDLYSQLESNNLEAGLIERLSAMRSNSVATPSGKEVWEQLVLS